MSTAVFIPKLWSARLLANLDKNLVFANLCNRDYEGEITKAGDAVNITGVADVAVRDYEGSITTDAVDGTTRQLVIDQKKYYSFAVDDVDQAQAAPAIVDAYMANAAKSLSDVADQHVASLYTGAGSQVGDDTTPVTIANAGDAYDGLVDLGVALTEKNVPTVGRWVVVPAFYEGLFRKDTRVMAAGDANAAAARIQGYVGQLAGFSVFVSNNAPKSGANYKVIAGTTAAMSFANQILKSEALRSQTAFADIVRGLHVYGAKVLQPNALAVLTCKK